MSTKIEWTDATWNPVVGCTKVSPGCAHCYAEKITRRFGGKPYLPGKAEIVLHEERLEQPLRWKRPRRVFANSMSDLFHEDVPGWFIIRVWQVMAQSPQHAFQILTKRPERMREIVQTIAELPPSHPISQQPWPLPNVWLGTSIENQHWADRRIPVLLETPAAVRFVSCEPLLGPLNLRTWLGGPDRNGDCIRCGLALEEEGTDHECPPGFGPRLSWLIVGGESGGPENRRMKLEWLESLVDQTRQAGVPLFVKQDSGRLPGQWGRIPETLRIREMPNAL